MTAPRRCLCGLAFLGLVLGSPCHGQSAPSPDSGRDRFAGLAAAPVGPTLHSGAIGYVPLAGWRVQEDRGAIVMFPPFTPANGPCSVLILPPMAASGDLAAQAEAIVNQLFAAKFGGRYRSQANTDVKTDRWSRYDGVSAAGSPYVDLYGTLAERRVWAYAHILLVKLGPTVVAVIGLTNFEEKCMAGHDNLNWTLITFGLDLPADPHPLSLKRQLIGSWNSVGSSVYVEWTFAANGQFADVSAHSTYTASDWSNVVTQETSTWVGDGTYEVHGERLTIARKVRGGRPETNLFSIVRRPNPEKPGGTEWLLRYLGFGEGHPYLATMTKE